MHFPKRNCLWTILLLSITIEAISLTTGPAVIQHNTPFWEFVLREFIFKTVYPIQSPLNYGEHKKILEAPFYGGSVSETINDENVLLSRGNVYHLSNGQWILCQESCINCELCRHQKHPIVKWTLRRVKRRMSGGLPKSDLQLTVIPQQEVKFSSGKYLRPYNYVYVTSQGQGMENGALEPGTFSSEETFIVENSRQEHSGVRNGAERQLVALIQESDFVSPETQGNDHSFVKSNAWKQEEGYRRENLPVSRMAFGSLPRVKRYRSKVRPVGESSPLTFFYPQKNVGRLNIQTDRFQDDSTPRLIMGIDQHGGKHLVHVLPVDSSVGHIHPSSRNSYYPATYRGSYQIGNSGRISGMTWQSRDSLRFQKLMQKVLDSLDTHQNFIELFLFSDKLKQEGINDAGDAGRYMSHSDGRMNNDERLEEQTSYSGYRTDGSPHGNQYPLGSHYRIEDRDEDFRRYADMTRKVNKPAGEYQDQNSMIEYEPYGTSADGSQNETLPRADDDRRRHNSSFAKLTDSTFGNRELNRNHTQMDTSDTGVFFAKRELVDNSSDQKLPRIPS